MTMTCRAVTHCQAVSNTFRPASRRPARITVRPVTAVSKSELISEVAERTELKKKEVELVVSTVLDVIMEKVANDEKVTLVGFGTFDTLHRAARVGRNPRTGEPLQIAAKGAPKFSAGKSFKDKVAAGTKDAAPPAEK